MYGPPPDPRQQVIAADPLAAAVCALIGLLIAGIAGERRPIRCALGVVIALTAPWAACLPTAVFGAFPTIDKAGSLAFYLGGVHRRLLDPADPGVQLIGVHLGHLWLVEAADALLAPLRPSPMAGFNLQWLVNPALAWGLTARLIRRLRPQIDPAAAFWVAMPYGVGLHVFHDIRWYTVEKTGVWWLPLYGLSLLAAERAGWRRLLPGLCMAGAFFYNAYNALVLGAIAGLWLLWRRDRAALSSFLITALGGLPLAAWQAILMRGAAAPGDPQAFLEQRAVHDVLSLWPPAWNRMELWRACDPVAVVAALSWLRHELRWRPGRAMLLVVLWGLPAVIALGPSHNPLYMLLYHAIPGFWRVAKPEVFFWISWLMLLIAAAAGAHRWLAGGGGTTGARSRRWLLAGLMVGSWLLTVRMHPIWPPLTRPIPVAPVTAPHR